MERLSELVAILQLCELLSPSFPPRLSASFHVVLGLPWVNQCHEIPSNPPANTLSSSSSCSVFLGVPCSWMYVVSNTTLKWVTFLQGLDQVHEVAELQQWSGLGSGPTIEAAAFPSNDHRSKDSGQGAGRTQIRDAGSHQGEAGTAAKCCSVLGHLKALGCEEGSRGEALNLGLFKEDSSHNKGKLPRNRMDLPSATARKPCHQGRPGYPETSLPLPCCTPESASTQGVSLFIRVYICLVALSVIVLPHCSQKNALIYLPGNPKPLERLDLWLPFPGYSEHHQSLLYLKGKHGHLA